MKHILLFFLLLFTINCFGQERTDSLQLFEPKSEPRSVDDTLMFTNSVILYRQHYYTVLHNQTEHTFTDISSLSKFFEKKAAILKTKPFYILYDSSIAPSKIVSVLDLMKKHKFQKFKMMSVQEYAKVPPPITIETPRIETTTEKYDSTYLGIQISNESCELWIFDKRTTAKTSKEIDNFIKENKSLIDANKIVVMANVNLPYDKFKPLLDILKKNGYYKYKLISQ